jgi:hypothetical protein
MARIKSPYAAPSTGAFARELPAGARQEPRVARGPGMPFWHPLAKARSAGGKRQPRRLLTRAFLSLALRAPVASQSAPGGFVFGYFLFDCKDAGGRTTQEPLPRRSTNSPGANLNSRLGWPVGRKPGKVFVTESNSPSGAKPRFK